MSKFKVGDKVRLTGKGWDDPCWGAEGPREGQIVEIARVDDEDRAWFALDGDDWVIDDDYWAVELVEEPTVPEKIAPALAKAAEAVAGVTYSGHEGVEALIRADLSSHGTPAETFPARVNAVLEEVGRMLISKNQAYGDAALNPKRVFSTAGDLEQINIRIDDKLSRIANGDNTEDVDLDLIGYLVLRRLKMAEQA